MSETEREREEEEEAGKGAAIIMARKKVTAKLKDELWLSASEPKTSVANLISGARY